MIIFTRSKRSLEKKEEPVPSPSMSGLQRTPKAEHPSRKRTVSQSSTSLSSGTGSGKEGSHSTKGNSTSKHRKGEDKGRSTRDGKVGVSNFIGRAFGVWIPGGSLVLWRASAIFHHVCQLCRVYPRGIEITKQAWRGKHGSTAEPTKPCGF